MLPAARLSDSTICGDVIATGSGNVFINNLPACRLSDTTTGHGPPPCYWPSTVVVSGSGNVFINNLAVVRVTDKILSHCCGTSCHDSVISTGSGNVFIG